MNKHRGLPIVGFLRKFGLRRASLKVRIVAEKTVTSRPTCQFGNDSGRGVRERWLQICFEHRGETRVYGIRSTYVGLIEKLSPGEWLYLQPLQSNMAMSDVTMIREGCIGHAT
ncbi:hypothetical protein ACFL0K_02600 [Patescibacteria group bacterium]